MLLLLLVTVRKGKVSAMTRASKTMTTPPPPPQQQQQQYFRRDIKWLAIVWPIGVRSLNLTSLGFDKLKHNCVDVWLENDNAQTQRVPPMIYWDQRPFVTFQSRYRQWHFRFWVLVSNEQPTVIMLGCNILCIGAIMATPLEQQALSPFCLGHVHADERFSLGGEMRKHLFESTGSSYASPAFPR